MKVLIVEDEPKLAHAILDGLKLEGYIGEKVNSGEDALLFLSNEHFDVVILDRMLEGELDGIDVCRSMRTLGDCTPVIMLTALNEVKDRIDGLDIGADDYLGKPFDLDELIARIRALVRRPPDSNGPIISRGMLTIDTSKKDVRHLGEQIKLSKKEFSLLEYLALNMGTVLSKDQIIQRVWDFESDILPNTVEATIKNIRKKISKSGYNEDQLIETVRGFGYRMPAESTQ